MSLTVIVNIYHGVKFFFDPIRQSLQRPDFDGLSRWRFMVNLGFFKWPVDIEEGLITPEYILKPDISTWP
jgi:hypothetical protein